MINILLFIACTTKHHINIGVVDIIDPAVCVIQMSDDHFVEVSPKFCINMKEGDIISIERKK